MGDTIEIVREGEHIIEIVRIGNLTYRTITNPKCVSCKCYWKPDNDDMKPSGLFYKSCRRCRKPKMTAEDIREKAREYARMRREKRKAELLKEFKH